MRRDACKKALACFAIGAMCCVSTAAESSPTKTVSLLDLTWSTQPPSALTTNVRERIETVLRESGFEFKPVPSDMSVAPGCNVGPCLQRLSQSPGVRYVVGGGVAVTGSNYDITLNFSETRGGSRLGQVSKRCDVCTFGDASKTVAEALKQLLAEADAFEQAHGWLAITSEPTGYQISLDDIPMGKTPLTTLVSPGQHVLTATHDGQPAQSATIAIQAGDERELRIGLDAPLTNDPSIDDSFTRPMSWGLWTILGLGGAMTAAGGALWAAADTDGAETAGIALVSAGSAALVSFTVILVERLLDD